MTRLSITILCFMAVIGSPCGPDEQPVTLIPGDLLTSEYIWSLDSRSIAFAGIHGDAWKLDTEARRLTALHDDETQSLKSKQYSPLPSIDGRILYTGIQYMPSVFNRPPWQLLITDKYYGVIGTSDFEGKGEHELKRMGGGDFNHARWSPDGSQIAFTQKHRNSTAYQLAVWNVHGSYLRTYEQVEDPYGLVWAPDGSHIAVVEQRQTDEERKDDQYHYDETIDHDRVVVVRLSDGFTRIVNQVEFKDIVRRELKSDGSVSYENRYEYRPLGNEVTQNKIVWSAEDDLIYFATNKFNSLRRNYLNNATGGELMYSTIYSVKPDGSDLQAVFRSDENTEIAMFDVSSDGSKILFVLDSNPATFVKSTSGELHVINSDGSQMQRLDGHLITHQRGSWSPDGTKIAFSAQFRDGTIFQSYGTFVMNSDGTDARLLLEYNQHGNPRLSDGGWSVDPNESILVGAETKSQKFFNADQSWTPNGEWIVNKNSYGTVLQLNSETAQDNSFSFMVGEEFFDHQFYPSSISTDGRILYTRRLSDESKYNIIKSVDISGKDDRELIRLENIDYRHLNWSPDGTRFAFTQRIEDPYIDQLVISSADGTEFHIVAEIENVTALVWSPDGSSIGFVEQEQIIKERMYKEYNLTETIGVYHLGVVRLSDGYINKLQDVHSSREVSYKLDDDESIFNHREFEFAPTDTKRMLNQLSWSTKDNRIYFGTLEFDSNWMENWHKKIDIPTGSIIYRYGQSPIIASTIYSINPDGTDRRTVLRTGTSGDIRYFNVSPDGANILLMIRNTSTDWFKLHLMNLDLKTIQRMAVDLKQHGPGVWSPDGSKIAFAAEFVKYRNYPEYDHFNGRGWIFVMNSDGTNARLLPDFYDDHNGRLNDDGWNFDPHESILVGVENE